MTPATVISKYRKAIKILQEMGLRQTGFVGRSQSAVKSVLQGREGLAAFDIDAVTKEILTTDENWALAAAMIAQSEEELARELISPGKDWLIELESRAYRTGNGFQTAVHKALGGRVRAGLGGIDATTMKLIRREAYEQIKEIAADQVEYLRNVFTRSILDNKTYQSTVNMVIRDGKIPALVDSKGRLIEMETRVEMIVHTETGKVAERGTRDKATEIYGADELWMRWHTIRDGRERASHAARDGELRKVTEWKEQPHPSDGKAIMPGEDPRCRCWGEYGTEEMLKRAA